MRRSVEPGETKEQALIRASIPEGEPQRLEHNDFRWITVDEIPEYAFCPADEEILTALMKKS